MSDTYEVRRLCFDSDDPQHRRKIKSGLTLEEAQAHCQDPETSSSTASDETLASVGIGGPWFDGYEKE